MQNATVTEVSEDEYYEEDTEMDEEAYDTEEITENETDARRFGDDRVMSQKEKYVVISGSCPPSCPVACGCLFLNSHNEQGEIALYLSGR